MLAVFSTLTVFAVSLIIIRIATVSLAMTGISKDLAQFQALSAFTGVGFTTHESEDIVNHPLRRRITMHLMLLGHVGIVVAIPSVILSFMNFGGNDAWSSQLPLRFGVLMGGLLLLLILASSRSVEKILWRVNTWGLRRFSKIHVHDYTRLLRVSRNYVISELHVQEGDWLAGHALDQLRLANEGVLVLGIEKPNGDYLGAPRGQTRLEADDHLILYGRQDSLLDLDERRAGMEGNVRHMLAVTRQMDRAEDKQKARDDEQ
ncbi:MAG: TrkA C-terminal domain-containing protein [Planctomycetales bacterium]|nr:TrkA C-terminal domain-containing protein [Planctomycetales bacterium]